MFPLSWGIAILVVCIVMRILAVISSIPVGELLRTDSLWPLVVLLPALFFGKVLGLMILNLVAFAIPAARKVFNTEASQTGRQSFRKAMKDLSIFAFITGLVTLLGATFFLLKR